MRRAVLSVLALAMAASAAPAGGAWAQSYPGGGQDRDREQEERQQEREQREREWMLRPAPLRQRPNAGPCPFVKILYDAARYVEFEGGQQASSAVGFTGEIEGLESACVYREADPIVVDVNILFHLGRGPQADGTQHTYRYWVAVTERNSAILAKEYFDLPVTFEDGADRVMVTEEIRGLTIPRRDVSVSGSNFEILVGFEVTPEMAAFNRAGARFRIDAGAAGQQ